MLQFDLAALIAILPKAIVLSLLSGFIVFLAKNWNKDEKNLMRWLQAAFFWGILLYAASTVILLLQSLPDLTDEILKNLPINAAVLSLSLASAILLIRGCANSIVKFRKWLEKSYNSLKVDFKEKIIGIIFLLVIFVIISQFSRPEIYVPMFVLMYILYTYVFDRNDFEKSDYGVLFYYFLIAFVFLTLVYTISFGN